MLTQKIPNSSAFISTWRKGTRCKLLLGTTEMLQCSFHWGCSGRAAGGAQELLQGWLAHSFYKPTCGRASSRAARQTTPSCFQGKPLFGFQSHSHMLSFLFLVLYAHSSHDDTLQLITTTTGSLLLSLVNQLYLPKRKDVWQLFLSVLWHQLLHCTMNHCYHLFTEHQHLCNSETKLGLEVNFNVWNISLLLKGWHIRTELSTRLR